MTIVGLGGLLNDAACAVLRDGKLVAAVEQAKIARHATADELPEAAIQTALSLAGVPAAEVDCVSLVRPFAKGPETSAHLELRALFPKAELVLVEHHTAHAASAYYASSFNDATVLTLDRQGDFRCGARWRGHDADLRLERELYLPDSLGDLYTRVTELLGFRPNSEEHKVQWLSTSGDDRFLPLFREMIGGPWPKLNRDYFDSDRLGHGGFSAKFYDGIGAGENALPEQLRPHVASGLQRAIEEAVLTMAGDDPHVCLAGGLGYNALLVAALERSREVFVQPAAGNSGTALGALYYAWHVVQGQKQRIPLDTLFLGPSFDPEETKKVLENCKLHFRLMLTTDELIDTAVRELDEHKIIAWMHGRVEFGPRALGNRSILASPLDPYSTENLNVFIKHREPFRKFAASVPAEVAAEYFEVGPNACFLATLGTVKPKYRDTFASAILGDGLVRVHTVKQEDNPLYHRLLHAAGKKTGLPVLYNTSFNLFGDPLVCTPRDAVRSFYSSGIDAMFTGNFLLQK